jgi:hypothetical protein
MEAMTGVENGPLAGRRKIYCGSSRPSKTVARTGSNTLKPSIVEPTPPPLKRICPDIVLQTVSHARLRYDRFCEIRAEFAAQPPDIDT